MEWLLYLLCPFMMLFCLKGMFTGGKKDCHSKQVNTPNEDMKSLQIQMQELQQQNRKLMDEMKSFKKENDNNEFHLETEVNPKVTS